MAAAHCATATATATATTISFHFPPAIKRRVIAYATIPSKPTKRKNYLRPKILKTLTKPYPIPNQYPPPKQFIIPIESPPEQRQQKQQQKFEFSADEFAIIQEEVKESALLEEQEQPELCSNELSYHEKVGNLDHIVMQQDHNEEDSESIERKLEFHSDDISDEGMKVFHSDSTFDRFAREEYDETDLLEQLPELDVDQLAGEKIAVSVEVEFSHSEETRSSPELVKPIAGNRFSSFSVIQIGLVFVGACMIETIWSTWRAKKVNSFKKDQNSGIIDGNNKPNSELLLKENNGGNNYKSNSELLLKENNGGNNYKSNSKLLLKENNGGNNKPNLELLLKENNVGNKKSNSELLLKENNVGNNKSKLEVLLQEKNDGNNKANLEVLLKENNGGSNKPNSELLLKENNVGNNKPNSEVLLKVNNDGCNQPEELLLKGNGNPIGIKNEGAVLGESEIDIKIAEIRRLAREAREKEKLKSEGNGVNEYEYEDDENDIAPRKKSFKKLSPEGLAAEEARKTLIFKKKYISKSLGINTKDTKSKGLLGRQDHDVAVIKTNGKLQNGPNDNDFDVLDGDEQVDLPRVDYLDNVSTMSLVEDKEKKLPAKETAQIQSSSRKKIVKERAKTKRRMTTTEQPNQSQGDVLGSSSLSLEEDKGKKLPAEDSTQIQGSRKKKGKERRRTKKPSVTASEKGAVQEKPVSVEAQIFRNFIQSKQHDMLESLPKKHDDLKGNGKLAIKEVGTGEAKDALSGQKSYANNDFWWLSLPYVLAIVLRNDGEKSAGLYTLRITSQGVDDVIYRVAFEHHTDATNFCHIIEYYFKELVGFSAEITSIPTNELEEAIKSKKMKLLVVKKGQVKLYAGQPLTDVEKALESLVNQN